jgi:hypothetical protein
MEISVSLRDPWAVPTVRAEGSVPPGKTVQWVTDRLEEVFVPLNGSTIAYRLVEKAFGDKPIGECRFPPPPANWGTVTAGPLPAPLKTSDYTVSIEDRGNREESFVLNKGQSPIARALSRLITKAVSDLVKDQRRPGGLLYG